METFSLEKTYGVKMPASSMDQVTQGIMQLIMQLNPKNLPYYFWTTYSSTCLLVWLEKVLPFTQGTLLPAICIYCLLLFAHGREVASCIFSVIPL